MNASTLRKARNTLNGEDRIKWDKNDEDMIFKDDSTTGKNLKDITMFKGLH